MDTREARVSGIIWPSTSLTGSASGRTLKLHSQKVYQAAGAAPAGGGPPTQGTWPRAIFLSFWGTDATHHEN
eukprot:1195768-Pyramimonas_sp.AAC.2